MSDFIMPRSATLQSIDNWANQIKMRPHNSSLNFGMNMTVPMNFNFTPIMPNFGNYGNTNNSASTEDAFTKYLREQEEKSKPAIEAAQKESARQEVQRQAKDTKAAVADSLNNLKAKKKSLEKNKKADGSSMISSIAPAIEEVEERNANGTKTKVKKVRRKSWLEKSAGFVMNGLSGIGNMFKGLAGFEKDGSWNPWKLVKNAAITAAAATACVFCPPLGTVMLYGGLAIGTVGMVKNGVERYNAGCDMDKAMDAIDNAKTEEERIKAEEAYIKAQQKIDESEQSFGQNAFLAVTSGRGAFKAGQAARTAAQTTSANGSTITNSNRWSSFLRGDAISAKSRTSFIGKGWEKTANTFYDTFTNPISRIKTQSIDFYTSAKANGVMNTGWTNMKNAYKATTNKGIYENHKQQMEQGFNEKINTLDNKIQRLERVMNNSTPNTDRYQKAARMKALLTQERQFITDAKADFVTVSGEKGTKVQLEQLKNDNLSKLNSETLNDFTRNANGKIEVRGVEIEPAEFNVYANKWSKYLSSQQKELTNIIREYNNTKLTEASPWNTIKRNFRNSREDQKIKSNLEAYAPTSSVSWFKNWTTGLLNTKQANAIGGATSDGIVMKYTKAGIVSSPSTMPKFLGMYDPVANMGNMTYVSASKYKEEAEYLDSLIKTQDQIQSKINSASTSEELELAKQLQIIFQSAMQNSDALVAQGNKREPIKFEDIEKTLKTAIEESKRQEQAAQQAAAAQTQQAEQTQNSADNTKINN